MTKKRIHVYYSGRVQGVGFRFTAEMLARELELVGWVKNVADGRVEVVCEGEEVKLNEFLKRIRSGALKDYIDNVNVDWSEATDEFAVFDIRFW